MKRRILRSNNLLRLVLPVAILLAASCGGRSDEKIQSDVQEKMQANAGNNSMYKNVTATVKDGVVQLSGECEGSNCADSAAMLVKNIDGVKNVTNNVKQAQTGTDLTLRTSVQTIISKYQGVQADVATGVVVLRGSIQRDQLQPLMNELHALQPKKIDNQLAIQQ
jgi:osmotically-inducible protein OsmY